MRAADLTDSTSSAVYPTSPAQRSQPGIEGDPRLGRSLTCNRGTWDDAGRTGEYGVSYEWYRNNVFISEGASYPVADIDVNKSLRCQVTVEGLSQSNTPDDLRHAAGQPDRPDAVRRRPARPQPELHRGPWDDPRDAVRGHLPVAAQRRADRRRHDRHLRDHRRRRQPRPLLPRHRRRLHAARPRAACRSSRRRTSCRRASRATRASATNSPARRGDWDDPATPYAVTYQWYRGGTAITDATNATYTLDRRGDRHVRAVPRPRRGLHDRPTRRWPTPPRRPSAARR